MFSKIDRPCFNQMTAVALSDILGFGLGFGVVALGLALKVMALALAVVALLTSLVRTLACHLTRNIPQNPFHHSLLVPTSLPHRTPFTGQDLCSTVFFVFLGRAVD